MNMAVNCGQHNVSDFSHICLVNEAFYFYVTFQPALFENIVSETVQHLQEIIRPKGGEEKVCHTKGWGNPREILDSEEGQKKNVCGCKRKL